MTIVLVTGSRYATWQDHMEVVRKTLIWASHARSGEANPDWELWQGGARGGDEIAHKLAVTDFGWRGKPFPAYWDLCDPDWKDPLDRYDRCEPAHRKVRGAGKTDYCPTAGVRRNDQMVTELAQRDGPKVCCAFPIPALGSGGTEDCLLRAIAAGILTLTKPLPAPKGSTP